MSIVAIESKQFIIPAKITIFKPKSSFFSIKEIPDWGTVEVVSTSVPSGR
jgi:hypothetical protein